MALGVGLKHSRGMAQEAFEQKFDYSFFFPALISLGNDQTHLHHRNIGRLKDLIEIPQEFPRKMWEINQVYLSYLENEGHLSDPIP